MFKNAIKTDILILYYTKMPSINRNSLIILLFILILGAFFRFWLIAEVPPGLYPDEAMNGNNAKEAILTGEFKVFYPENNGREGLFINLQALSIWIFGNEAWALRVVSAIFGTLTILGIYLFSKELFSGIQIFKSESLISKQPQNLNIQKEFRDSRFEIRDYRSDIIALLSSFFIATSYWHINFSRIGFRAIMVPFFAVFGIYFLLKGFRNGKILDMVWAGIFIGLGFHTYIAFRFMPFVLAAPVIWCLWKWRKKQNINLKCAPCAILLFIFVTFAVALPIGYYFLQNPHDFLGRGGQVSIFSSESPAFEFIKSNILTFAMLFYKGDCNPRHNFACKPELNPITALSFLVGLFSICYFLIYKQSQNLNDQNSKTKNLKLEIGNFNTVFASIFLLVWLFVMSLPATLTREGVPHALRSIGMIPPIMILSGFGVFSAFSLIFNLIEKAKWKRPLYENRLNRIKKEIILLVFLIFMSIPFTVYRNYFLEWAWAEETYYAFSGDIFNIGKYLKSLPKETKKVVFVNSPGVEARGIPMPAQPVMFATGTFEENSRLEKNFIYIKDLSQIENLEGKTEIVPLNPWDKKSVIDLRVKFPELKIKVPGDFIVLEN